MDSASMSAAIEIARSNLVVLVDLLRAQGYRFAHPERALSAPSIRVGEEIEALESRVGAIPFALREAWRALGSFDLTGSHPDWPVTACLMLPGAEEGPGGVWLTDPLVLYSPAEVLGTLDDRPSDSTGLLPLWPDAFHKAGYSGGGERCVVVPSDTLDGVLVSDHACSGPATFFEHLRWALLDYAGFPGFEAIGPAAWPGLERLRRNLAPFGGGSRRD